MGAQPHVEQLYREQWHSPSGEWQGGRRQGQVWCNLEHKQTAASCSRAPGRSAAGTHLYIVPLCHGQLHSLQAVPHGRRRALAVPLHNSRRGEGALK